MNVNQVEMQDQPKGSDEGPKEIDAFKKSLKLAEQLLRMIGLRVEYDDRTVGLKWLSQYLFMPVSFIQLVSTVAGETIYFSGHLTSLMVITAIAPCLGFCLMGLSKMYAVSSNRYLIQDLVNELRALWPTGELSEETKIIMAQNLRVVYLTTTIETGIFVVLIFMFNLNPIIPMTIEYVQTGHYQNTLPYFVWYPFDSLVNGIYHLAFVYQNWSGLIAVLAITGIDCLFQASCSHICMLLQLLQGELRDVIPEPDPDADIEELEDVICLEKLMRIIEKHQKLLSLCEDLETTYSFDIFVNVIAASLVICTVGFQSIVGNPVDLIKFFLFLCACVFQTLILSYYGNKLIDRTGEIADAAYNCRWYLAGPRFKSNILQLIARAQKPSHVTALGFATISLITFTSILGRSWSYFTLLRTIYDPNAQAPEENSVDL